eukprot:scaffold19324_cov152-Cylindrotheca_fusiformis.AAC.5
MSTMDDHTNFIFDRQPCLVGKRYCASLSVAFPEDVFNQESAKLDAKKEKENLDRHLAASMGKLSVKDREAALEEVHGIVKNDPEDSHFLQANLQAMENRVNSIKHGTVYEQAEAIDPCFVSSREMRLLFLRGNRYDPNAAAEQLIKHFDMKFSLFGSKKLTKNINLLDLDENDRLCLESGFCQFLPQTDVAGRTIVLILPGLRPELPMKHCLRALHYLAMTSLQESEEAQKKGIIAISYAVGRYRNREKGAGFAQVAQIVPSIPIPLGGVHLCFDERDFMEYVHCRAIILVLPTIVAAKTRTHFGTHMECLYSLRGYGIVEGSLPMSQIGADPLLQKHGTCYEQRKKHSENSCLTRKIEPRSGDVLFGQKHQVHPGNIRLRKVLADHSADYEAIDGKKKKMEYAESLVRQMKSSGSRFLMFDQSCDGWTEVSDKMARNKISKTLRNSRRPSTTNQAG